MVDEIHDREGLIALTSDIVAAHVSNNSVAIEQVPTLITSVFQALSGLGVEPVAVEAPALQPAVSIRASIRPDHVACLECGKKMKLLKRHLSTEHGLTTDEYRQRWGLAADHALVAPNYAAQRSELANKIGLGRKPTGGRKAASNGKAVSNGKAAASSKDGAAPKVKRGRKLALRFTDGAANGAAD